MKRWLFIFGRQPEISLAEILSVLNIIGVQYTPVLLGRHELMVSTEDDLGDPQNLLDRLGGTIKLAEVDESVTLDQPTQYKDAINELLRADALIRNYRDLGASSKKESKRWTFGLSLYAPGISGRDKRNYSKIVHAAGLKIKSDLKSKNISSRFVAARGKDEALSSVTVKHNKLLRDGNAEIVLVATSNEIYRGKTAAAQDFESYGKRDFGRPSRNARAGSLPPKLAQMLINLATLKDGSSIHDPFVGQGTILQEAALMDYEASGSDESAEQIEASKENLQWLSKVYGLGTVPEVRVDDAKNFQVPGKMVSAIVTEGTLGPPRNRPVSQNEAVQTLGRISRTWLEVLKHSRELLSDGGVIVCVWPVLEGSGGTKYYLDILDEMRPLGYRLGTFLAPGLAKSTPDTNLTDRGTLLYSRPGQIVQREIIKLIKT